MRYWAFDLFHIFLLFLVTAVSSDLGWSILINLKKKSCKDQSE